MGTPVSIEFAMKLGFILTEGQTHDNTQSDTVLQGINTDAVVAGKALDSDALLHTITDTGPRWSSHLARTATRPVNTMCISTSTAISLNVCYVA